MVESKDKFKAEREQILNLLRMFKESNSVKYGIESLAIFGSVSRCEHTSESDIDILVELKSPSLYIYAGMKDDLERLLGRKVDIISAKSIIRNEFKESISKDLIYV